MRKLLLLVSIVVLVDTSFYAAITPLLPELTDEYGLSKTGAGILAAAYPIGTFVGGLPGGLMAARVGVRPTVLAGLALMVLASIVFAFAGSIVVLDVARFVQGVGGAASWAGAMAWLAGRRAEGQARADDRLGDGRRDRRRAARPRDRRHRRPGRLRARLLLDRGDRRRPDGVDAAHARGQAARRRLHARAGQRAGQRPRAHRPAARDGSRAAVRHAERARPAAAGRARRGDRRDRRDLADRRGPGGDREPARRPLLRPARPAGAAARRPGRRRDHVRAAALAGRRGGRSGS